MDRFEIDINCDVGEGVGNEGNLLPLISSCNIACGGHAGDNKSMKDVIRLAKQHHVKIGAHPSYPDRENFGRVSMHLSPEILEQSIKDQLEAFMQIMNNEQAHLHHIKPHGALYNDIAKNAGLAKLFLKAVETYKNKCSLYVPFGSKISEEANKQGFQIKYEAFADRNYNEDLSLVSRSRSKAIIEAPEKVLGHLLSMIKNDRVITVDENSIPIKAETFCVHGDTPSAYKILTYLSHKLPEHQVRIKK